MTIIKNGKLNTITKGCYENGAVIIENGKITAAGDADEILAAYGALENSINVIDAKGGFIMPGLIDAHCHVGMWEDSIGEEGDDGNEETDPVMPHLKASDGVFYMDRCFDDAVKGGVTTVVTGPGSANVFGGQFAALKTGVPEGEDRTYDNMLLKDSVAMKIALGQNPKIVYGDKKTTPCTRMATMGILRETFLKGLEYAENMDKYNKERISDEFVDKPEFDIKMEAISKVLSGDMIVKAHAHRADDILSAIRLSDEFNFNLTIEHCTEGHMIVNSLVKSNAGCIVGPFLTDRSKIELRNLSPETPGILANAGLKVAIMTDHPCTPIQYLGLCAAVAVKYGMKEEDAIKAVTVNAAELTGISDRVGSIEPGKDADIIILSGDFFDIRAKTKMTMINGEIIYNDL